MSFVSRLSATYPSTASMPGHLRIGNATTNESARSVIFRRPESILPRTPRQHMGAQGSIARQQRRDGAEPLSTTMFNGHPSASSQEIAPKITEPNRTTAQKREKELAPKITGDRNTHIDDTKKLVELSALRNSMLATRQLQSERRNPRPVHH